MWEGEEEDEIYNMGGHVEGELDEHREKCVLFVFLVFVSVPTSSPSHQKVEKISPCGRKREEKLPKTQNIYFM
jgi:hypothetical protein